MHKWLARLSFSFIIVAALLAWELNKAMSGGATRGRVALYIIGIALCFALGVAGIKARHGDR